MRKNAIPDEPFLKSQILPIFLTLVIFLILVGVLYGEIFLLNKVTFIDISTHFRITDILIGLVIYLKTSIDFAIFIGNLMRRFPGWRNRVAIEIGTAVGNALGTLIILGIWNFFRNIEWLLGIMIFIASLVLLRMAEDGLEHARSGATSQTINNLIELLQKLLFKVNLVFRPLLQKLIPNMQVNEDAHMNIWKLFYFSLSVPFILGLDDFAGYVPLFSVINVFGFAIGVFAGHMVLNALLFISPKKTVQIIQNVYISLIGSFAFILLALWGIYEVVKICIHIFLS